MTNLSIVNVTGEETTTLIPGASFVTKAAWSHGQPEFEQLNTTTDRGEFGLVYCFGSNLWHTLFVLPESLHSCCRIKVNSFVKLNIRSSSHKTNGVVN